MRIGITCYPTYGGSGAVATELGMALARRGQRGVYDVATATEWFARMGSSGSQRSFT